MKTIISLTTIPPRLPYLRETLLSLQSQTAKIDRIILWMPASYRRRDLNHISLPVIDLPVELISCSVDYGPATKLLPALSMFADDDDVRIIYCDDDRYYHPSWAQTLMSLSDRHPNDCIAGWGMTVKRAQFFAMKLRRHDVRRILRPFWWKSVKAEMPESQEFIDIAEGFSGVLVKPKFFTKDVFCIPDTHWMVDDVWFSGHLAKNGIKIRRAHSKFSELLSKDLASARISALLDFKDQNTDRHEANMRCIRYFQETYHVWPQ